MTEVIFPACRQAHLACRIFPVAKPHVSTTTFLGLEIPSNIRWMVFKVKQRAKTNYFDKVIRKQGVTDEDEKEKLLRPTFNWPYDYFSLVELVKINASVVFADGAPIKSSR